MSSFFWLLGYPFCHQIPERCFQIANFSMPLCARCSGVYVGFIITLASLWFFSGEKKRRGVLLPELKYLSFMILFVIVMMIDVFAGSFNLYQTNNYPRLITGLLFGFALANFLLPVFNFTFWHRTVKIALLDGRLFYYLLAVLAIAAVIIPQANIWLLWFFSILSIGGIITLYILTNSLIILIVFKKENLAQSPVELLKIILTAGILSFLEILALALVKNYWLARLNL